jgi:putative DNA primase/helicase
MQGWLLDLRRRGISVLIVHHAGKAGKQRGTSKREDVLDSVVALRRPDDYKASEGARFTVHLEKARGLFGPEAESFEAALSTEGGQVSWSRRPSADPDGSRIIQMIEDGKSIRDIAHTLGRSKSSVGRLARRPKHKRDVPSS